MGTYRCDPSTLYDESSDEDQKYANTQMQMRKRHRQENREKLGVDAETSAEEDDVERPKFRGKFQCKLCPDKILVTESDLMNHLKTKPHIKAEKKYYRTLTSLRLYKYLRRRTRSSLMKNRWLRMTSWRKSWKTWGQIAKGPGIASQKRSLSRSPR